MLRRQVAQLADLEDPINDSNPIRVALLGSSKTGKTCLISKLAYGIFRDTYYPTTQINPILFNFSSDDPISRTILDGSSSSAAACELLLLDNTVLSPLLYKHILKIANQTLQHHETQRQILPVPSKHNLEEVVITGKNEYYKLYKYKYEDGAMYIPPHATPILVELIDTPSFKPSQIVPFLEASLHIKLGREVLRNLADEPRKPVLTNPLLVASGASEMNGNIDGYFFVYSLVPSYNPPSYNDVLENLDDKPKEESKDLPAGMNDETFNVLAIMKQALNEAWQEYNTFKSKWEKGKEHDMFSIKNAMRNMWLQQNPGDLEKLRAELRTEIRLMENPSDPADPNCPPPIWLVCTNVHNSLSSPKYIENGMKLAKFWNCGFVAVDSVDENIDMTLSLMIREIVKRKRVQKRK